ncbi:hypothetical protein BWK63_14020 [Flavobacterium covae]|uniref:HEAT repeat domain-containing protein n=1 Tax=Flavobacterium covae TaxID=2906076 RepID=A0ABW8PJQ3_9FLAO|nr:MULTISPECIES: hypothetical protein [Flavobacterium]MCJ1807596.1 hypothetical protein [Flavobacterium covae]OWP79872.1 hypothetical protein BWK63_14020 [Flavobacterium covae]OXA73342.1 hypothetical protein B0A56_13380 [Flavobacterium columnare NBRC 100251 = ATCC 23463]POR20580.1 hypothetical protein BWK57_13095 [Flavobacterium columnare]
MKKKDKDIILRYAIQEISKSELYSLLPNYSSDDNLMQMYYEVLDSRDAESLQYLNMIPKQNIFKYREIGKQLLSEAWHTTHEDLVGYFQLVYNESKENISVLLSAINNVPEYLQLEDFKYPFIRKLIYAIGAQPEPYNIEALEKLANETNDEQIKQLALHQIEKRKELGRWEAAKNA